MTVKVAVYLKKMSFQSRLNIIKSVFEINNDLTFCLVFHLRASIAL